MVGPTRYPRLPHHQSPNTSLLPHPFQHDCTSPFPSQLGHHPRPSGRARVRPTFSYKDALLSPPLNHPPLKHTHLPPAFISNPALPLRPPNYLLNPSLRDRCYRCFERGHIATRCREPRRCLFCMRRGHLASSCRFHRVPQCQRLEESPQRQAMEPGPSADRPEHAEVFLLSRPPIAGQPSLSGCVVRVMFLVCNLKA